MVGIYRLALIRMVCLFVCVSVAMIISLVDTAAITNSELLDLLNENSESEVQENLIPNCDEDTLDDDDDVIDLPGNPEDEADIITLVDKLSISDMNESNVRAPDDPLVRGGCSCRTESCTCCIEKKVTIKVLFKKMSKTVHVTLLEKNTDNLDGVEKNSISGKRRACVTVRYVPSDTEFLLTFTFNGKIVYHKEMSLNHPPMVCAKSGTIIKTYACLVIYNVNLSNKSLCTRLTGLVNFRIKKIFFKWHIACFRIPTLSRDWLADKQHNLPPRNV